MLKSHIVECDLQKPGQPKSTVVHCPDVNFWGVAQFACNESSDRADDLLDDIREHLTTGLGLSRAIEQACAGLDAHEIESLALSVCRVDDGHYELSWLGEGCAYLLSGNDSRVARIPSEVENALSHKVSDPLRKESALRAPSSLADWVQGETLILSARSLGSESKLEAFALSMSAATPFDVDAPELATHLIAQCESHSPAFAVLRFELEQRQESPRGFIHREPSRSLRKRHKTRQPVFWGIAAISFVALALVM